MSFFLYSSFFLILNGVDCTLTVEYYENIISENLAKVRDYEMPQSNREFEMGAQSREIHDFGSYDFIIVGAGSAGSVLATRLSEIDDWSILLLEAGGEENDFSKIPAMVWNLQFTEMNWGYFSTPQKNCCLGMKDKKCMVPRGKSIGGSSAINALTYSRGNPKDYDKWAQLGNPGWSYEKVLPYFIKSENSQIDGDADYHGKGALWNVEYSLPPTDTFHNFIEGNAELKQTVLDYNGRNQLGVSKTQINVKHGQRQSTGTAFLENARHRKNLKVITQALVIKINMDKNKVAEGVLFVKNDKKFRATAKKEVIVSGGAINSPQLLMLSGIGPKDHLKEIEIELIEDLPVGENLLDHPLFLGLTFHTNYTLPDYNMKNLIANYLDGSGLLTNPATTDAIGFIHTGDVPEDVPMIEYIFIPPRRSTPIVPKLLNYNHELTNNYLKKITPTSDITINLALLHQKSKGRVTLQSNNPIDFPNIDFNLFEKSEDVDNLIKGIDFVLKLMQTEAFRKINATLVDIPICEKFEKHSKLFWECAIRHMTMTIYHACGTTAMGPDKRSSVVDHTLRVHGIQKLRVVDAGIFPSTVSGHTNAPTVMVAEKISDDIKRDYVTNLEDSRIVHNLNNGIILFRDTFLNLDTVLTAMVILTFAFISYKTKSRVKIVVAK